MAYNLLNGPTDYQAVAVSQTDLLVQGASSSAGAIGLGSYIRRIIVTVATAATSTCSIKDGSAGGAIPITVANTPIGVYVVDLDVVTKSTTANMGWYITTGAGATAVVQGHFLKALQ